MNTPSRSSATVIPGSSGPRRVAVGSTEDVELPPYRKPSHTLTDAAKTKLRELNDRAIGQSKENSRKAGDRITEAAALVLDALRDRQEAVAKERTKWDKGIDLDNREDEEGQLVFLEEQVDDYMKKSEEAMRAVIDNDMAAQRIEDSLKWLRDHAPGQLERDFASQRTQLQSQARRTQTDNSDGTQVSVGPTPGPTPLDGSRPSLTGTSEMYAEYVNRRRDEYTSISFSGRYSRNEAYTNFKKMVHDAKYGDDRPLPHPDTWFTETGSPAPGVTGHGTNDDDDDDDDDDIVVERATTSIRCPLTFQSFKEPFTSSKCPHTFEQHAIFELIRKSSVRLRGGEKAVTCPVTGCDQVSIKCALRVMLDCNS